MKPEVAKTKSPADGGGNIPYQQMETSLNRGKTKKADPQMSDDDLDQEGYTQIMDRLSYKGDLKEF